MAIWTEGGGREVRGEGIDIYNKRSRKGCEVEESENINIKLIIDNNNNKKKKIKQSVLRENQTNPNNTLKLGFFLVFLFPNTDS